MANETSDRPRLTPKGARTRARIVEEAAALIHERGVAATTLEDVKVAAEVSGSQMYHYFPDKNELVQAVIDYQADTIVNRTPARARQRERSRSLAEHGDHRGEAHQSKGAVAHLARSLVNSPRVTPRPERSSLQGSISGQPPSAMDCRSLHAEGKLPSDIDPDDLATTLLATLEGGLLLAQVQRSTRPFETAVNTLLALALGR